MIIHIKLEPKHFEGAIPGNCFNCPLHRFFEPILNHAVILRISQNGLYFIHGERFASVRVPASMQQFIWFYDRWAEPPKTPMEWDVDVPEWAINA